MQAVHDDSVITAAIGFAGAEDEYIVLAAAKDVRFVALLGNILDMGEGLLPIEHLDIILVIPVARYHHVPTVNLGTTGHHPFPV